MTTFTYEGPLDEGEVKFHKVEQRGFRYYEVLLRSDGTKLGEVWLGSDGQWHSKTRDSIWARPQGGTRGQAVASILAHENAKRDKT